MKFLFNNLFVWIANARTLSQMIKRQNLIKSYPQMILVFVAVWIVGNPFATIFFFFQNGHTLHKIQQQKILQQNDFPKRKTESTGFLPFHFMAMISLPFWRPNDVFVLIKSDGEISLIYVISYFLETILNNELMKINQH